jgi:hypothetical protein
MAKEKQQWVQQLEWARWATIVIAAFALILAIRTAKTLPDKDGGPNKKVSPKTQHLQIRVA